MGNSNKKPDLVCEKIQPYMYYKKLKDYVNITVKRYDPEWGLKLFANFKAICRQKVCDPIQRSSNFGFDFQRQVSI